MMSTKIEDRLAESFRKAFKKITMEIEICNNFNNKSRYAGIKDRVDRLDGKNLKYREIEEVLTEYSESEYKKRRFTHYTQKMLMPEAKKTGYNQAEYGEEHVGIFCLIDQLQAFYSLEDMRDIVNEFNTLSEYISYTDLLEQYGEQLNSEMELGYGKKLNEILESENKRSKLVEFINSKGNEIAILEDEEQTKVIEKLIKRYIAMMYLAEAKASIEIFNKYMQD